MPANTYNDHPAASFMMPSAGQAARTAPAVAPEKTQADRLLDAVEAFEEANSRMGVVTAIRAWAETMPDELDDGESMADRLIALLIGTAAPDAAGELSEEQSNLASAYLEMAADALVQMGASEEDAIAVIDEGDAEAAQRVADFIASEHGEADAEMDEINRIVFSDDDQAPLFDAVQVLDAVYKARFAVRGGRKMRIMKRVGGSVRLSGAQKIGLAKARMKSHSAAAKMRRMKSLRVRHQMGIKPGA